MPLRSIEILVAEHREVEKVLLRLEEAMDEFLTVTELPPASVQLLDEIARSLDRDLSLHIQKEDSCLFPVLHNYLPAGMGPIAVMMSEHELISAAFHGLTEGVGKLKSCPATNSPGACEVRDHGRELIHLLRSHLMKEERVLFPFAEEHMTGAEERAVLAHFEKLASGAPAGAAL